MELTKSLFFGLAVMVVGAVVSFLLGYLMQSSASGSSNCQGWNKYMGLALPLFVGGMATFLFFDNLYALVASRV